MKLVSRTSFILILILICLFLGAAVVFFLFNFEKVSRDVYVGYRGEARTNVYLAAERLLTQQSFRVKRIYSQVQLRNSTLPEEGTVFFLTDAVYFNKQDLQRFVNWVEDGGHLIVSIHSCLLDEEEPLAFKDYFADLVDAMFQSQPDYETEDTDLEQEYSSFTLPPADLRLDVRLDRAIHLTDQEKTKKTQARWYIGNTQHRYFLQYQRGRGKVSLLGRAFFMENANLASDDNAFFLWYLTAGPVTASSGGEDQDKTAAAVKGHGGKDALDKQTKRLREVWFISERIMPSLAEVVWERGWPILISLGMFVFVLCWRVSRRLGPLLVSRHTVRRSLLEYVTASGRFLWRHKQSTLLAEQVRLAVKNRLFKKYRYLQKLSAEEQLARLRQIFGSGKTENVSGVDFALLFKSFNEGQAPVKLSASRFFNIIKSLERIRKVL